jgi:hypothetical protein
MQHTNAARDRAADSARQTARGIGRGGAPIECARRCSRRRQCAVACAAQSHAHDSSASYSALTISCVCMPQRTHSVGLAPRPSDRGKTSAVAVEEQLRLQVGSPALHCTALHCCSIRLWYERWARRAEPSGIPCPAQAAKPTNQQTNQQSGERIKPTRARLVVLRRAVRAFAPRSEHCSHCWSDRLLRTTSCAVRTTFCASHTSRRSSRSKWVGSLWLALARAAIPARSLTAQPDNARCT